MGSVESLPDLTGDRPQSEAVTLAETGTTGSDLTAPDSDLAAQGHAQVTRDVASSVADSIEDIRAILPIGRMSKADSRFDASRRGLSSKVSGGGGIRTHGQAEPVNGFQDRPDQPLWHPSGIADRRQMAKGRDKWMANNKLTNGTA